MPHYADILLVGCGRPERCHGGLRRCRLLRHRPSSLKRRDSNWLPVCKNATKRRLIDNYFLAVLQHQHLRLFAAMSRPQDLPDLLCRLHHHNTVLLLLGMVLDVLGLLWLLVHRHP